MSKLNLDLFGDNPRAVADEEAYKEEAADRAGREESVPTPDNPGIPMRTPSSSAHSRSPKFVPVGFDSECLTLLDDAVLALRRQGHWRASKSAIIRSLIKLHRTELINVFLSSQGQSGSAR